MAQCKDCIHEKVCLALIKHGLPWNDGKYPAEKLCFEFLNKADVVPKSEIEKTVGEIAKQEMDSYEAIYKQKVAREIFEEIEKLVIIDKLEKYCGYPVIAYSELGYAELKKQYTEETV
jgi:ribosome biogenesis GTPase A